MDTRFPEPDCDQVRAMVTKQFPEWTGLEIRPVDVSGWDNRTFHLGETLLVRMPSAIHYVAQVDKEQEWLPTLSRFISLSIPAPVAKGAPCAEFPQPWSIYRWIPGETLASNTNIDQMALARALAGFLRELQAISISGAPRPGPHCFYRGAHLDVYDAETRQALDALADSVDVDAASAVWNRALESPYQGKPVWFHGDIAPGNLLLTGGRLSAVIDFGCCGVGDPACDLAFAWTDLQPAARERFLSDVGSGDEMTSRAMGWALWKALIVAADCADRSSPSWHRSMKTIHRVLANA
ncbi:MAG: aminoglycoside phosphotransferase family protein [Armatimonadota bacterium]